MWNLKPVTKMLDALWTSQYLVVCGRQGFQRVYDLPERVLPASALKAPISSESEALRALVLEAIRARGVLTARGVVNHYKLEGGVKRVADLLQFLIKSNAIRKLDVEDGDAPVYVPFDAELDAAENAVNARSTLALREPALGSGLHAQVLPVSSINRGLQQESPARVRLLRLAISNE